ncbi:MAG: di-trans,poly-cis-decaprenylcistransferase [Rhodothermaceae bacterium]|nr:di-trans,poly-cis-decaprenylcistransferase [Rhodothermaceae bacterium]
MQSSFKSSYSGLHVACILDGNGRWAERRGLPRPAGHRAGVEAVRRIVEAGPELGVGTLSLYAFSADNWKRPSAEVRALMTLLRTYLRAEIPRLKRARVRLTVFGRRDRLPEAVRQALVRAEWETRHGDRLHLRVAVDYAARDAIRQAAVRWAAETHDLSEPPSREAFAQHLADASHSPAAPPVDLLIRTGGEQRLSDFLLWECAYAELLFLDTAWPDVTAETLADALAHFRRRERRFGGLPAGDGAAGLPPTLNLEPSAL